MAEGNYKGPHRVNGPIYCDLNFNGTEIKTKLNVVSNDFPIPVDGILGKDFIYSSFCKLDYGDMTFTIRIAWK